MKLHTPLLALALLVGCAPVDEDFDGVPADQDCDDNDNLVFPGAVEMCDGIDNDCNGVEDDDYARGGLIYYIDADGDGFGATSGTKESCAQPEGYVANATDCDDTLDSVNPGADETCNLTDDNCNGQIDDDAVDAPEWHADWDQDGYGSQSLVVKACEAPEGYLADAQDCNDFDRNTNPLADEVCDRLDNNCDGDIDEDSAVDALEWYGDVDGDGYGDLESPRMACWQPAGYTLDSTDCDDSTGAINPGAEEICRDGLDNNCNESADHCSVAGWESVADATIRWEGANTYDYLGWDTDFVGDIDGDGFDDLIMGARYADAGGSYSTGSVYVAWGAETDGPESNTRKVSSLPSFYGGPSNYLGETVGPAGDVNNDGYADFLMGGPGFSNNSAVIVYGDATRFTGQSSANNYAVYKLSGSYNYCGSSVWGGADLDGDGNSEFMMACGGYSSYRGHVSLFAGSATKYDDSLGSSDAQATWQGSSSYEYMGRGNGSLGGGDFDGDGNDDLMIASYGKTVGSTFYAGTVYIHWGDGTMPDGAQSVGDMGAVEGTTRYGYLGYGIGSVGDLNDDGYEDMGMGAYGENSYAGGFHVFFGSATQLVSASTTDADLTIVGANSSAYLGRNSPAHGDFDGDGIEDVAVGSYRDTRGGGSYNGSVWVLTGDSTLGGEYDQDDMDTIIAGPAGSYGYFGYSQSAGDFNGDGYMDLASGAYGDMSYSGTVNMFEGTSL